MRAIFNCRPVNGRFAPPHSPILLPALPDRIRLAAASPPPCVFSTDLRHWFYQIPIPHHIRDMFTLGVASESGPCFCRLRCLLMGFSWSPFIAQGIMWAAVLATASTQLTWHTVAGEGTSPPALAHFAYRSKANPIHSDSGVIFIWYGNIICWSISHEALCYVANAIDTQARRLKMVWKGGDCYNNMRSSTTHPQRSPRQRKTRPYPVGSAGTVIRGTVSHVSRCGPSHSSTSLPILHWVRSCSLTQQLHHHYDWSVSNHRSLYRPILVLPGMGFTGQRFSRRTKDS